MNDKIKLSIPTYLFSGGLTGERKISDMLPLYRKNDIKYITLNFTEEGEISFSSKLSDLTALSKELNSSGVYANSISTILLSGNDDITDLDVCVRQNAIITSMIEIAEILNIPSISIRATTNRILKKMPYFDAIKKEQERIDKYSAIAKKHHVEIFVENVVNGLLSTHKDYQELLSSCSDIKLAFDTANSYFVAPVERWLTTLGPKIGEIQITDLMIKSLRGILIEFVDPGNGLLDFVTLFNYLKTQPFTYFYVIESFAKKGQDDQIRIENITKWWNKITEKEGLE